MATEISRGINATVWFTWPRYIAFDKPGLRMPPLPTDRKMPTPADFRSIQALGFRSVRLAVDPALFEVLLGAEAEKFKAQFVGVIRQIIDAGMTVVVDLHPNSRHQLYGQTALRNGTGTPAQEAYVAMVSSVAAMLKELPPEKLALELMNEPRNSCTGAAGEAWLQQLDQLIEAATQAAPRLPLVVSGACTSSIEGLLALTPARWHRKDIYYTFHFYEPFAFTHQGAPFIPWPERYLSSVPWPVPDSLDSETLINAATARMNKLNLVSRLQATAGAESALMKLASGPVDAGQIESRLKLVADWADKNAVPRQNIYLGEFGVYAADDGKPGAACDDQARWVTAVRQAAEQQGFSWAFFHLDGAFGLLDQGNGQPKPALLKALGLSLVGACPAS